MDRPSWRKSWNKLAAQSGRAPDELAATREMLDRRFNEIESGKVKLIDGEEALPACMKELTRGEKAPHERLRFSRGSIHRHRPIRTALDNRCYARVMAAILTGRED
jgi:hypothetical protein